MLSGTSALLPSECRLKSRSPDTMRPWSRRSARLVASGAWPSISSGFVRVNQRCLLMASMEMRLLALTHIISCSSDNASGSIRGQGS